MTEKHELNPSSELVFRGHFSVLYGDIGVVVVVDFCSAIMVL